MSDRIKQDALEATKWSSLSSVAQRVTVPINTMILARILSPEDFGVSAAITMILSFCDLLSDAGFQKYLIQHEFGSNDERIQNANVAFWTNIAMSICIWVIILVFRDRIATAIGIPGLGTALAVSCIQLIFTSFTSIHIAMFRRDFEFKTIFSIQLIIMMIPFVITIPLAFAGLKYWSLIIGSITAQLTYAVVMTIKSKWRPKLIVKIGILKEMLSFSTWSLLEALSVWMTIWADVFIIATSFSQYYLGLYRTSVTMVNSLMALVTSATVPVLYSTLSRLQNDRKQFNDIFCKVQRMVATVIFPLGVGMFVFRFLATSVLFGNQWSESREIIGIYALTTSVKTVFCNYANEAYRALGKPRLSSFVQLIYLAVLIPVCFGSVRYGFWTFVIARSLIQLYFVLVNIVVIKLVVGLDLVKFFKGLLPVLFSVLTMGTIGYLIIGVSNSLPWSVFSITICATQYFGQMCLFPSMRREIFGLIKKLLPSRNRTAKRDHLAQNKMD